MLQLSVLLALSSCCVAQISNGGRPLIEEKNVLSPPYFNIATGKKIDTTATCGTEQEELFCKLTGGPNFEYSNSLHQGQVCDVCDATRPEKSHPISNTIDGTEKWWQSPPLSRGSEFNRVNVTIHLGQVFHVAYVLIKFANSPRAGTWVLERSSDNGKSFQPWQYFANTNSDCYNLFGMSSLEEITRDDSVICTSDYSGVVPLENGEVIVSMIKGRPGALNFSHSTVLQEWSKATDVRLRLLRTKTLLGHLMAVSEQDPTVTRRYYYSIKDVSIGGRCVCNGHADTCLPDPYDDYKLKCRCQHNTCGDSCEYCCPGYVQKAWRVAVPESTNECEACNCHGHSTECLYDEEVAEKRLSLDLHGNYEGGGVCQNCQHNTTGVNCEQCASGFWRPSNLDPRDAYGCRPCECDSAYTIGSCEPNTGRCYCKVQYAGDRCDRCAPGYYEFPECRPCDCYYNGTLDDVCLPIGDACPCKYNFAGKYCEECGPGFYNFPQCAACQCEGEGVASDVCDPYTGMCPCLDGFTGTQCMTCADGYFNYPLCQRCPCSEVGTKGKICDPETGVCDCADKYAGRSCDECKPGYFGFPQCQECQCTSPGSTDNLCDTRSGRCFCNTNYQGERCEECASEYYGYPSCVSCACNRRGSLKTTCDETTGQCLCRDNIGGRSCDSCNPDYFNFPRCEECSCDARGIVSVVPGVCLAFTTGQCDCKENVIGKNCDTCKPLHYDINQGCISCNCFLHGTLDGVGECDTEDGSCWCKPYTCSQRCSQCEDGFYALEERNYLGCSSCECDVGGALTSQCDKNTGQCVCKSGIGGRRCDSVLGGYFYPTLYQNQYELEEGRTPDNNVVRAGFDQNEFPNFSLKGYAQYSVVQRSVVLPITVHNSGLYRLMFRFVNSGSDVVSANVTLRPKEAQEGEEQSQIIRFDVTSSPSMVTLPTPFVLNRGSWTVTLEAGSGLLVDYLVLLPSQYYEPGILDLSVTSPCLPTQRNSSKECVMFTHLDLMRFTMMDLTRGADDARLTQPSSAHPEMLQLDGVTGITENSEFTTDIKLPKPGKYVLVLEYASNEPKFQLARASVTDGAGKTYNDAKFNIYSCGYSFLCRQVALGVLNDVKVFEVSLPVMKVNVQTEIGGSFFVRSLTAIPYEQWSMELVEPKPLCITTQGPQFASCVESPYEIPIGSLQFDVPDNSDASRGSEESTSPRPPNMNDNDAPLVYLDGNNGTGSGGSVFRIPLNLKPGRYIFLLHYYNPKNTGFSPRVVVDGGVATTGSANISYCPNADGCRAVVISDLGEVVLDITVPTTMFSIVVPEGKSFWLQDILAVPEDSYNPSVLQPSPIDKSSDFLRQCSSDGQQSFYSTIDNPSEECLDDVFSITVNYNEGGVSCNCSSAGTIGGADAQCQGYGGQCPCKTNVIGRQCDQCKPGYYGYPNCQECECDGGLCDVVTGECICPLNTVQPSCKECVPFTHSFHPLLGCVECECNINGVINVTDRGCDPADGQCKCKDHVTGQRCDRCEAGYFGFPDCRLCTCDDRGADSDGCDPVTGQCFCKPNVEGLQCDRCRMGSFHLDANNPQGCTECFCFGAPAAECHSSQYPATEIYEMQGWRILNLATNNPIIRSDEGGRAIVVDIIENNGTRHPNMADIYWAAPKAYLEDKVSSYGGELRYTATWRYGGRGDADDGGLGNPAPLVGRISDVKLQGNQMTIGWVNPEPSESVRLELTERNFQDELNGRQISREDMMMILAKLQALHIRASPDIGVASVKLQDVVLTTTDYSLPVGSAESIPAVEDCSCPEGYRGHSCQLCNDGYYREKRGPYLGYCRKCDCFGHCVTCDDNGAVVSSDDCLHNTAGPDCGVCQDGYIGNATTGEVEACTPCPCPYPSEDGNFANTCEEDNGELVCYCKEGYTGDHCQLCATGYFGNPQVRGGFCQPCDCHGNLDPNLIVPTCDPLTGQCSDCAFNTGGKYCEKCANGYYGDAIIARNCTECSCYSCGTEVCDHMHGYCSCRPHVIGQLCDTCEPGYFGFQSCSGCRSCDCDEGSIGHECDSRTGQCQCAPNVVGLRCDRCAPGYWDYNPSGCRPCNCRTYGMCNPVNGKCECPPGIVGPQCDQCALPRQVLEPGASECTRCDRCIDNLLDDVEAMTEQVKESGERLKNTSLSVLAWGRLRELQRRAADMMGSLSHDEGMLMVATTAVTDLLNGDGDEIAADVSGSGEETIQEEDTAVRSQLENKYHELELRVSKTETDVSEMCNHTKSLLQKIQTTHNATSQALSSSSSLQQDSEQFQLDAKDLLDKLSAESSGDSEDYFEKLRNAEMMLDRMKKRDFNSMMKAADDELSLAEDLMRRVDGNFTSPATNMSNRVEDLTHQFTSTQNKLRDLRDKMNDATAKSNEATTANSVNRKNLATLSDGVTNINREASMAEEDIEDARQLLDAAKAVVDGPINAGISELERFSAGINESYNQLLPVWDQLLSDLKTYGPYANMSLAKSLQLEEDANALENITGTDLKDRIDGANAYQRIINLVEEADHAADEAVMASRKAEMDVADKNLQQAAGLAEDRSSRLLSVTQDLKNNQLSELESNMENNKKRLNDLDEERSALQEEVNLLNQNLNALNRGNLDEDLARAKATSADALRLAEEAANRTSRLEELVKHAPSPDVQLDRVLERVRATVENIPSAVDAMESVADDVRTDAGRLARLSERFGMRDKIMNIRKKIEMTRNLASVIKDSMLFSHAPDSRGAQSAELRIPSVVQNLENYLEVSFAVKVNPSSTNNLLMYYGDGTEGGDYVSAELVNGRVRYNYKVAGALGQLESEAQIANDLWATITMGRLGNDGKLLVEYPVAQTSRGDDATAAEMRMEMQIGTTNGEEVVSGMRRKSSRLIFGGYPLGEGPSDIVNYNVGDVCMSGVKIDNETIGMWNFKVYQGSKPGKSCESSLSGLSSNQMWRFRGHGSYIRVQRSDTPFLNSNSVAHFIGFKLATLQANSLVFVVGESLDQFIALQVVNGSFVLSWNFGSADGPTTRVIEGQDVTQYSSPPLVKAGLAPGHSFMLVSVNLKFALREKYVGEPHITGDMWIGGQWYSDVNPQIREHLANIDTSFRGCIQDLNFNGRSFNIQNAIEMIGVTRGCQRESVQSVAMQGNDYMRLVPDLDDAQNVDGGLVMRTSTPTGTMMSITETQANGNSATLFLRDGHVVWSDGYSELETNNFYSDGRDHVIRFKKRENGEMELHVDNSENKILPANPGEASRRRRQNVEADFNAAVFVYLGGAPNYPMYDGCIKFPYLRSFRGNEQTEVLIASTKCGVAGTVCGGRPQFNVCGEAESENEEEVKAHSRNGKRRNKKKRKKHRTGRGNVANNLLVIDSVREGYEIGCNISYRPTASGYRYTGEGYSKYYVKLFNPENWRFTASFRSVAREGIIFFMSDTRCNEHIAVYLVGGKVVFSVKFGRERSRLKTSRRYNDGSWHQVTFERKANSIQLMMDGSIEGHGVIASPSRTFPLNMPYYIGGLHAVQKNSASEQINLANLNDFEGCIKDVEVNNQPASRSRTDVQINTSPCFEAGTEPGMYFPFQEVGSPSAYLMVMSSYNVAYNMEVTVDVKPRSQTGIIFAVAGSTGNFFNLALVDGNVVARLRQSGETLFSRYDPALFGANLCDGNWHNIRVIKAKNIIALTVDNNLVTPIEEGSLENANCITNSPLFVGGLPDGTFLDGLLTNNQYTGCMRRMRVDLLPINTNTAISSHGDITSNACPA